jgi:hypothetical protein
MSSQAPSLKPPTSAASFVTSTAEHAGSEPVIAAIYSPHGVSYDIIEPWISSHLVPENARPVAMIHSTTAVTAPWYSGGNIIEGCPGGLAIAKPLLPTVWVAAHDVDNPYMGGAVKNIYRTEYNILDVETALWEELIKRGIKRKPQITRLEPGETIRVDEYTVKKIEEKESEQDGKNEDEAGATEHGTETTKNDSHSDGM